MEAMVNSKMVLGRSDTAAARGPDGHILALICWILLQFDYNCHQIKNGSWLQIV